MPIMPPGKPNAANPKIVFTPAVFGALNSQYTTERYSEAVYLALASKFEALRFRGFAAYCRKQASDESSHAAKIFGYMADRGTPPTLEAVAAPPVAESAPLAIFRQALAQEQANTESIWQLCASARADEDEATFVFMQWFVSEQVEEEKAIGDICSDLEFAAGDAAAILFLDNRLGN